MQLQGALAPLCGTNVLVWDNGDHFYTLHYRHRPRPTADAPEHRHQPQIEGSLDRQASVATQDPSRRGHHCFYHQIRCTFLSPSFIRSLVVE